jgi:predicted secreted hydrolase
MQVLGGATDGYARALEPRKFSFPQDHGPHPAYRTEWWYYTGNLETQSGRHFGFQLTFFRSALAPQLAARKSAWGTGQVYMAHFAVTDVENKHLYAFERFSRAALGLAGAQAEPFRVWLEDWSVEGAGQNGLPMRLRAREGEIDIDLSLQSMKPIVLQGDAGLSQKGPEAGNASYYYSLTRMPTQGTITVADETFQVSGTSWMDREWSTSVLGKDQVGWDWFALQLSDGSELMFFQLRNASGETAAFRSGTLIRPDGETLRLKQDAVHLEVQEYWHSPRSAGDYPARWRLQIPAENLAVEIIPYIPDQELSLSMSYWEGAVRVQGSVHGEALQGHGYAELTGYHKRTGNRAGMDAGMGRSR